MSREDVIDYMDRLADTILDFDTVAFDYYYQGNQKTPGLLFKKIFEDGVLISFDLISNKKRSMVMQTLYLDNADYQKKKSAETLLMQNAHSKTPKAQVGQTSVDSISQTTEKSNASDENILRERNALRGMSDSEIKRSVHEQYISKIGKWDKDERPDGEIFIIGSTSDVLQGLGAIDNDIFLRSEKINKILSDHPEMTLDEIKKIPRILENPVLILKSRNVGREDAANSRMVLFGTVKAQNGLPVMAILDLRPEEDHIVIDDMQKVTSAYAKTNNPVDFVRNSDVMYASKGKATSLLRTIGFQIPIALNESGFIGSISYKGPVVKLSGKKFSEVL